MNCIAVRCEDKNKWEKRTPIVPQHISDLKNSHTLDVLVQSSENRAFPDQAYEQAGATVRPEISDCRVVFSVKEIPVDVIRAGTVYVCFSHTIKGQSYNMPMLQKLIDLKCTLVDYECIVDSEGKRLVFFGRYAGLAGMIDTLYTLGQRLMCRGIETPFQTIQQAYTYASLEDAMEHIRDVGRIIQQSGLPDILQPFVCGFSGYGHVSKGAQEIFDLLPHEDIAPDDLPAVKAKTSHTLYKVVFREEHLVEPVDTSTAFDLNDYYLHPDKYQSRFEDWIPYLSVLVNGIYWDDRYPRLITKTIAKKMFMGGEPALQVVGDISCDIHGAIEFTEKVTEPDQPSFVYNPKADSVSEDLGADGIAVMAVDNLPAEIPADASVDFSSALKPFVPAIAAIDLHTSFEKLDLPPEIKNACIVYRGELTPRYQYLSNYLKTWRRT